MIDTQELFPILREQLSHTDAIQWAVLILGVAEVLLARANNIWLYPAGIAATVLAVFSLYTAQLYAESLLHFYYIVMSLYGWWFWMNKKNAPPVKITYATSKEWIIILCIVFGGWGALTTILITFTDSTVPVWDAWITSTAWAGMWLLARRKIENWILLNLSNAFAIPLLFHKELPLFALLTIFLFIIACKGYVDWIRLFKKSRFVSNREQCVKVA